MNTAINEFIEFAQEGGARRSRKGGSRRNRQHGGITAKKAKKPKKAKKAKKGKTTKAKGKTMKRIMNPIFLI
jgi:hypothetical protein